MRVCQDGVFLFAAFLAVAASLPPSPWVAHCCHLPVVSSTHPLTMSETFLFTSESVNEGHPGQSSHEHTQRSSASSRSGSASHGVRACEAKRHTTRTRPLTHAPCVSLSPPPDKICDQVSPHAHRPLLARRRNASRRRGLLLAAAGPSGLHRRTMRATQRRHADDDTTRTRGGATHTNCMEREATPSTGVHRGGRRALPLTLPLPFFFPVRSRMPSWMPA